MMIETMKKKEIAEILWKIGAVSLNPTNPFKYASGMLSPIYTDCRVLTSHPDERRMIIDHLVRFVTEVVGLENIDVIVGTAHSGISLATYLAQRLGIRMAYIRTSTKDHGKRKQIEGIFNKDGRALLVSDIMSTEMDIPISVDVIKRAGGRVVYCLTIFSNKLGIVEKLLDGEEIKHHSLTDLKTLLFVASIKKKMTDREVENVAEWMRDPENWDKIRRREIEQELKENERKIASTLLRIGAITLNLKEPYRFSNGILSPIYADNRLLMSYPEEWKEVIDSMIYTIINRIGTQNVDVIAGTATAGISHATYLAERLGLPMIYVKSDVDQYGKITRIEGHLKSGDNVLIIEDLISSGKSAISSANVVRDYGGIVDHCLAIFTYEIKESIENFKENKIRLIALTNLKTLLDIRFKRNYFKPEEKRIILEWTREPYKWGK